MTELTPSQAGEIDNLTMDHPDGKLLPGEDGAVVYKAEGRIWTIGPRGKVSEQKIAPTSAAQSETGGDTESSEGQAGLDSTSADGSGDSPSVDPGPSVAPSDEGKDTTDVVVPDPSELAADDRSDAYRAMSKADERQVALELEGNAPKAAVYSFKQGGQSVVGLSWKGIREVVRTFNARGLGEIRIDGRQPPQFEDVPVHSEIGEQDGKKIYGDVPGIRCTVYAEDAQHGGGNWGTATATRDQVNKRERDGDGMYGWRPDGFASTKALSKAQRNALEPLVPLELVEELKASYIGQGRVQYIPGSGRETTPELPPALTDDRAKKQLAEARELYAELGKLGGRTTMPPALFNRSIEQSQHDHDRLDDFLEYLRSAIAEAQA